MTARHRTARLMLMVAACMTAALIGGETVGAGVVEQGSLTLTIRGQAQTLRTYGRRGGDPVIVSSGDGGWVHLAPHVAETLAARGYFVIGLDVKSYLSHFTSSTGTLRPDDVPGDYGQLLALAGIGGVRKPVLVGVSEGAGLSVLAAADPRIHSAAAGVVGIGLPAVNELGWRFRDSLIYLTHGTPNEPTFSTAPIIGKVAPLPLAAIHSTHDEFLSSDDARVLVGRAGDPKRLWIVSACDHRFSDNLQEFDARLIEAMAWIRENALH